MLRLLRVCLSVCQSPSQSISSSNPVGVVDEEWISVTVHLSNIHPRTSVSGSQNSLTQLGKLFHRYYNKIAKRKRKIKKCEALYSTLDRNSNNGVHIRGCGRADAALMITVEPRSRSPVIKSFHYVDWVVLAHVIFFPSFFNSLHIILLDVPQTPGIPTLKVCPTLRSSSFRKSPAYCRSTGIYCKLRELRT